jgi:hypothetical protein
MGGNTNSVNKNNWFCQKIIYLQCCVKKLGSLWIKNTLTFRRKTVIPHHFN